jgi:hypothetical protein
MINKQFGRNYYYCSHLADKNTLFSKTISQSSKNWPPQKIGATPQYNKYST